MSNINEYVVQLENEIDNLKSEIEKYQRTKTSETELIKALGNMPDGTMYRTVREVRNKILKFEYVSDTWEKIMGVSVEETKADAMNIFRNIESSDLKRVLTIIEESLDPLSNFSVECRYNHPIDKQEYWMHLSSYPTLEDGFIFANGFIFDITKRKRAEEKLLLEKERIESLGNNIPDSTLFQFFHESNTRQIKITYVSAKWESITGMPAEVAMSSVDILLAIIHSDDLPHVVEIIRDSSTTMNSFCINYRISVQGETRWVEMAANPIKKDNIIIWDGLLTDITQRKKAENDLENEKKRLKMFGDNIPGSTLCQFIRDNRTGQMRISYVSGTWESVTGVPEEVALADMSKVFDIINPDDLHVLMKSIEESARIMEDHFFETKFGDQWVKSVARPRKEGAFTIWDAILTNITDRKKIENELESEKNKHKTLGDNIPDGSLFQFVRDTRTRQMRLSYVSTTWESVTGVPINDSLGDISKVFSLMPLEDFPSFLKDVETSALNLSDFKREIRLGERWLRVFSRPRKEDTIIMWDGLIINITEAKKIESELTLYREKLEEIVEKRTNELKYLNDELNVANEELNAANEELNAINDELYQKNQKLAEEVEKRIIAVNQLEKNEAELSTALYENKYQLVILDLLVEASGIGLWDMQVNQNDLLNPNNAFMWSNEFRKLLGYTSSEDFPNILSSWSDKLHPQEKEKVLNAFEKHLCDKTGKTPYNIEYRLLKKDGEYGYFKAYGSTIRDNAGNAMRVAGAIQDITKDKQIAEEMLRHEAIIIDAFAENQYQLTKLELLVEATRIGMWDMQVVKGDPINPKNSIIWSDEFRKMLGYANEEEFPNILSSWSDKLHPEDKEKTLKAFEQHLTDNSGKTPYSIEYKLLRKDGSYGKFHACGATIRDNDGTALRVAGAIKEIFV